MTKAEIIKKEKRRLLMGKNMVISIGINKYKNKADCLNNCESDASLFYSTFKECQYLSMMEESKLIISNNESVTSKVEILNTLSELGNKVKDGTNIIFYYSGHGCMSNDEFYFFVSDSNKSTESMISLSVLLDILNDFNNGKHGNITVLIDACREKVEITKGLQDHSDNFITNYLKCAKGTGVIFSCSEGEYSLDCFNNQEISVFTTFLLDALKGQQEALDGDHLTFQSIYNYINNELIQASMRYTQINQHPQFRFEGTNIVYAIIDEENIKSSKAEHCFFSFEENINAAMGELRSEISAVVIEKCITVDNEEWSLYPSRLYIIDVCQQLFRMNYISSNWESIVNELFYYESAFEQKRTIKIPQSEAIEIMEEIWSFIHSIPTYLNDCFY